MDGQLQALTGLPSISTDQYVCLYTARLLLRYISAHKFRYIRVAILKD